jgi:hypothetical protein
MAVFIGPPKPRHDLRQTWRYRCAAPAFNPLNNGRCGREITGWQREPVEDYSDGLFRQLAPGPVLTHLPCGHDWWIGQGWEPKLERVPWA